MAATWERAGELQFVGVRAEGSWGLHWDVTGGAGVWRGAAGV